VFVGLFFVLAFLQVCGVFGVGLVGASAGGTLRSVGVLVVSSVVFFGSASIVML